MAKSKRSSRDAVIVFSTASSIKEAYRLTDSLLKSRLAACVSMVPRVRSKYWWKGKIEEAREVLLVIKTTERILPKLISRVKALHSYEMPEVLAFNVIVGNVDYLKWLKANVRGS